MLAPVLALSFFAGSAADVRGADIVQADVLVLRAAPAPDAEVIGRLRINTKVVLTGLRDAGYAEVALPFAVGASSP